MKIQADKRYSLDEIIDLELIPGVTGYAGIYNLVKVKVPKPDGTVGRVNSPNTTKDSIKPIETKLRPGAKISGKLHVLGREIEKYLRIHNLI